MTFVRASTVLDDAVNPAQRMPEAVESFLRLCFTTFEFLYPRTGHVLDCSLQSRRSVYASES